MSSINEVYSNGVLRERFDDDLRRYKTWDASGNPLIDRPYTNGENLLADARVAEVTKRETKLALVASLRDGIFGITTAKQQAQDDILLAQSMKNQADALKSAATTQRTQVNAWNPAAAYSVADMNSIKAAIVAIITRQETIIQAISDDFGYRKAVDANAVLTDDALLGLARIIADSLI